VEGSDRIYPIMSRIDGQAALFGHFVVKVLELGRGGFAPTEEFSVLISMCTTAREN